MTTTATEPVHPSIPDYPLDYERTLDRGLVHRDSLGEVFLTDMHQVGERRYVAGAQLPRSHAFYGDHLHQPVVYDPVLLLEACRQSGLAAAHAYFGVPNDHKFVLTHLRISLTQPGFLPVGGAPCKLRLLSYVSNHRRRGELTTGTDSEIEIYAGTTLIGRAAVGLRFKSPADYLALRLKLRSGRALPYSHTCEPLAYGSPVTPFSVGRTDPFNVVLTSASAGAGTGAATLHVNGEHPSLFDHPQDHVPGMVIAEAGRQLSIYTALESQGMSPSKTLPRALSVTFHKFGELDAHTTLVASMDAKATVGGPSSRPELAVQVAVHQADDLLSDVTVILDRFTVER